MIEPVTDVKTQLFGERPQWNPNYYAQWGLPGHNGVDYGSPFLTEVMAAESQRLVKIGFEFGGFGNYAVQDCGKYLLYYCHLESVKARVGKVIAKGEVFARSGYTGACYPKGVEGAHLHWGKRLKTYPASDVWKGWRDPLEQGIENEAAEWKTPELFPARALIVTAGIPVRARPEMSGEMVGYTKAGTVNVEQIVQGEDGTIWGKIEGWTALFYGGEGRVVWL